MSSYDRALNRARVVSPAIPEFATIVEASARDRAAWKAEGHDRRIRASRWLLVIAVLWPLGPAAHTLAEYLDIGVTSLTLLELLGVCLSLLPLSLLLAWAAYLCRIPSFRANILVRGFAASQLVLMLVNAVAAEGLSLLGLVLVSVAAGRVLQLLGEHGLDGSEDPESRFEPVKFRGVLTLALILAMTDAVTLLVTSSLVGVQYVYFGWLYGGSFTWSTGEVALTFGAAVVMAIGVWGLSRLRTWALISNMIANIAIAALALSGTLVARSVFAWALATTAGLQLLLPLPLVATALGYHVPESHGRLRAVLLRIVVPGLVLLTIVLGLLPLESMIPHSQD